MTNTLEGLLADLLRREKNSLEIISLLQQVQLSTDSKLVIEYLDADNQTKNFEIPSTGFLISELQRVDRNLKSIMGIGSNSSSAIIKYDDGTFKTVFVSQTSVEPEKITNINKPVYFKKAFNKISEKFLNPSLFASFDITDSVNSGTKQVISKRFILKLDDPTKLDYFNINLNGQNIDHGELIKELDINEISYDTFEDRISVSPKLPKYRGYFTVTDINKRTVTQIANNKTFNIDKIFYKLDSILYSDLSLNNSDVTLKAGDRIIVNNRNSRDTIYKIDTVDTTTNEITVLLLEGYDAIKIGVETLMISPGSTEKVIVDIPLMADEFVVLFIKPVNPVGEIINLEWGSGVGYNSSEFIDADDPVNNSTLLTYFNTVVDSFGKNLTNMAKERLKPAFTGLIPNVPVINQQDLVVKVINNHKNELESANDLRQKLAESDKTKSDIRNIDKAIEEQKTKIASSDFNNIDKKDILNKELTKLFDQRSSLSKKYVSLIEDLLNRSKDLANFVPKYAIRGFYPIPDAKFEDDKNKTGAQQIIQFIYRYRYLKTDETSTESDTFKITGDSKTKITATFSKWIEVPSKVRKRTIDDKGVVTWEIEDLKNPDEVNINQIDIPITSGEKVEIQAKSVSEAGYPYTPLTSNWSDSVIISFPEELKAQIDSTLEEIKNESVKNKLIEELNGLGLYQHLSDSIISGEKQFYHNADNIAATDFRTSELKTLSVAQVLKNNDTTIKEILAIISKSKPQIAISITDDVGNLIQKVTNNDTINIFAGYYKELIDTLPNPKGEIVTKLYFLEIENTSDVDLEILSYVPGMYTDILPEYDALSPYIGYIINRDEYNFYRKYWNTPLSLRGSVDNDILRQHHYATNNPFVELPAFQSSQVKGQIVACRNHDITLSNRLYDGETLTPTQQTLLPIATGSAESFVWDFSQTLVTPNGGGNLSDFCIHVDHPALALGSDFMNNFALLFNLPTMVPVQSGVNSPTGEVYYPQFVHSKFFELESTEIDGLKQLSYIKYAKAFSAATVANFAKKIGFTVNDKYLIGKNTCGSYLFLAPQEHKFLHTGSVIYNEGKVIIKGSENKIRIPFIFQFRMEDYYGTGPRGKIGGYNSSGAEKTNLSFAKKLGIDIAIKDSNLFSFDIRCEAKYKPSSVGDIKPTNQ